MSGGVAAFLGVGGINKTILALYIGVAGIPKVVEAVYRGTPTGNIQVYTAPGPPPPPPPPPVPPAAHVFPSSFSTTISASPGTYDIGVSGSFVGGTVDHWDWSTNADGGASFSGAGGVLHVNRTVGVHTVSVNGTATTTAGIFGDVETYTITVTP
jgi:hypothetical protein